MQKAKALVSLCICAASPKPSLFDNVISIKILLCTVKPVLSGHTKIDKTKVLKTNGSLMKVVNIAEYSP